MTEDPTAAESSGSNEDLDAEDYGSLSIEDDEEGTVDPAELAGTAAPDEDAASVE